mmetsp:Transcript_26018/g.74983  ORF Transcript_26018/g.74983 Transcript_26018/m.74983 type:complete len:206 (+) Transcript_26018:1817-2434(+)
MSGGGGAAAEASARGAGAAWASPAPSSQQHTAPAASTWRCSTSRSPAAAAASQSRTHPQQPRHLATPGGRRQLSALCGRRSTLWATPPRPAKPQRLGQRQRSAPTPRQPQLQRPPLPPRPLRRPPRPCPWRHRAWSSYRPRDAQRARGSGRLAFPQRRRSFRRRCCRCRWPRVCGAGSPGGCRCRPCWRCHGPAMAAPAEPARLP